MKLMLLRPPQSLLFSPLKSPSLSTLSLFSTSATLTSSPSFSSSSPPYGPSLHKGSKPHFIKTHDSDPLLNQDSFTREFNISALRVPADLCFGLENRLRGHLLNWPRIRNIARVYGDEIDDETMELLNSSPGSNVGESDGEGGLVSLNRRIFGKSEGDGERLSEVLYRDELVRSFDAKGFVKFRNVAKLSRPKKRRSKGARGDEEGRKKRGGVYVVEVVDEEESGLEGDDLSGLLGEGFKGSKWRGSTRLLLLDERYFDKELDEMPVAIKVLLP